MAYSLHNELTNGTLQEAFISYSAKKTALRVAREIARKPTFGVARIVVDDANEVTVASFNCPKEEPEPPARDCTCWQSYPPATCHCPPRAG